MINKQKSGKLQPIFNDNFIIKRKENNNFPWKNFSRPISEYRSFSYKNTNNSSNHSSSITKKGSSSQGKSKTIENIENRLLDITYREIDRKIGMDEQTYCFCNYVSYGNMVKCARGLWA